MQTDARYTLSHWGIYHLDESREAPCLEPWTKDPAPTPIGQYQWEASASPLRVTRPAIRKGWLEHGPGPANGQRGREEFVEVEWDEALDLIADEIKRIKDTYGNESMYPAPYGWSSAGRFHHAQTQARRFYNCLGGFVASRNSYSYGTAESFLPMVAASVYSLMDEADGWDILAKNTALMLCIGGLSTKNAQIESSGAGRHQAASGIRELLNNGARLINISPLHHQVLESPELDVRCDWWPIRPNTDTALLLALSHYLVSQGAHDQSFIDRYTSGYQRYAEYLLGEADGQPKDADWASRIIDFPVQKIRDLGDEIITCMQQDKRILINVAWGVQRTDNGEQPLWAALGLAALMGQLGLPGGGFAFGYASTNSMGYRGRHIKGPSLDRGHNAVNQFIPVARIADMLLHPGEQYSFENTWRTYPHIRLLHWAGGNPFHHHQDLNRLCRAWQTPDTIIANEQFWTPNARMADIVLPSTTTLERNDIGYASSQGYILAMQKMAEAPGEALNDHEIFSRLAKRLDIGEAFTEGLDEQGWLSRLYDETCKRSKGIDLPPDYATLRSAGVVDFSGRQEASFNLLPGIEEELPQGTWAKFRSNPDEHPLPTHSGKIELFNEAIAAFVPNKLAGHPEWKEPVEWLGSTLKERYPLHLISNQPANKLHSQLDHSELSQGARPLGREPLSISPEDASRYGIKHGELVRVFNERGSCLASVFIDTGIRQGVVKLSTGAWFDPGIDFSEACVTGLERHGNPNVLIADRLSSPLTQGCSAMSCLVQIERFESEPPELSCFTLPKGITESSCGVR